MAELGHWEKYGKSYKCPVCGIVSDKADLKCPCCKDKKYFIKAVVDKRRKNK